MTTIKVCKKCNARKGTPHRLTCVVRVHPQFFTDDALYIAASGPGTFWSTDTSSSSCDTSSSDSGSGGSCD